MSILLKIKQGTPHHMSDTDTPTFERYRQRINMLIQTRGIDLDDLPDVPLHDWYEQRLRPVYAANKALKNAGADAY